MTDSGPDQIDLRPLLPAIHDQGPRGTCLAFAVTAAHEVARSAGSAIAEDLSEEVLYWACKQVDGDHLPGTAFTSAAVALDSWGQPLEAEWPYDALRNDLDSSYMPPPNALDPATCYRAHLRQVPISSMEIRSWLAQGRPVAVGLQLSLGFFTAATVCIPMPSPGELLAEGHAVLAVGYVDGPAPGEGHLILRNSWGSSWGDGGYGYLPYSYVDQHGLDAWIVG